MILVEISGPKSFDLRGVFEFSLAEAADKELIIDAIISASESQVQSLWYIRENISEANKRVGAIVSSDVSVPIFRIPEFVKKAEQMLQKISDDLVINCFGHLGDGNLHYNVFPAPGKTKNEYFLERKDIQSAIHQLAVDLGGSISAEHGIGQLKLDLLKETKDKVTLDLMRDIKRVFDPKNLLNPGKIL